MDKPSPCSPLAQQSAGSRPYAALTMSLVLLAGLCAAPLAVAQTSPAAAPIAVVNGKPIPVQRLEEIVSQLASQGRPDTAELRAAIRDQLIMREIFAQEADAKGFGRSPDVTRQLEQMREDLLIRALIQDHLANIEPVTDEDVNREYQRVHGTGGGGDKEYRARHILVDKEDDARQIIAQLRKGEKFETLARRSRDIGSAQQGGDLDWATPDTYVKEFSEAMVALQKGRFTEKPVRTQFGFHVIRLDDVRTVTPPPIAQIAPQIRQDLERARIERLQQTLRAKAKVQ
ncbi:MAG: peptidylprolyl isomerase [Betaproteobacteria bacterium]